MIEIPSLRPESRGIPDSQSLEFGFLTAGAPPRIVVARPREPANRRFVATFRAFPIEQAGIGRRARPGSARIEHGHAVGPRSHGSDLTGVWHELHSGT